MSFIFLYKKKVVFLHAKYMYMKKTVFILLFFSCSLWINARTMSHYQRGDYHFGYVSLSAGYTSLSQNISNVSTKGNLGALIGAGYEFRMHNAWVSVGVQFQQLKSTTDVGAYDYIPPYSGLDNQSPARPVDYYRYTIQQKDKQVWRTIDIPIMVGYYNHGFYFGLGAKVGFNMGSKITTSGTYDLAAKYTEFVGEFHSTPDFTHPLYHLYEVKEKEYDCKLRPQFSIIGEIGYDLLSSLSTKSTICHMLNIGFYWECGLRSVRPSDSIDPIAIEGMSVQDAAIAQADVCKARMNPYYLSTMTEGKFVVPFYVGIKLTYLIGSGWNSTATWHKGCQCYEN